MPRLSSPISTICLPSDHKTAFNHAPWGHHHHSHTVSTHNIKRRVQRVSTADISQNHRHNLDRCEITAYACPSRWGIRADQIPSDCCKQTLARAQHQFAEWWAALGADDCAPSQYAHGSNHSNPPDPCAQVESRHQTWAMAAGRVHDPAWMARSGCSRSTSGLARWLVVSLHAGSSILDTVQHNVAWCLDLQFPRFISTAGLGNGLTWLKMHIRPIQLQAPPFILKGGLPLQSCQLCGFSKDNLPCVCLVVLAMAEAWFTFPAK